MLWLLPNAGDSRLYFAPLSRVLANFANFYENRLQGIAHRIAEAFIDRLNRAGRVVVVANACVA